MLKKLIVVCLLWLLSGPAAHAEGQLTDYIRIKSEIMGYDIQYQVYTPENYSEDSTYPTIYITDGPMYIHSGRIIRVLDRLIAEGKMKPVVAVFIDQRDPDDTSINRRNNELLCNADYVAFLSAELVGQIETDYNVSDDRKDRVIQGVSFGGFNAACVGLIANKRFYGISMHSPANTRLMRIMKSEYEKYDVQPVKMFMSVGNNNDNRQAVRSFKNVLEDKGYDLKFMQNDKDHEWSNWRPLLDDALLTFFAK